MVPAPLAVLKGLYRYPDRTRAPKAETTGRLDKEHREIAARPQAPVEGLHGGLCPLGFAALIGDPCANAVVQVGQKCRGIGRLAAYEATRP